MKNYKKLPLTADDVYDVIYPSVIVASDSISGIKMTHCSQDKEFLITGPGLHTMYLPDDTPIAKVCRIYNDLIGAN